jgi:hypothetical protein
LIDIFHLKLMQKSKVRSLNKGATRHIKERNLKRQVYRKQPTEDKLRRFNAIRNRTNALVRGDHKIKEKNYTIKQGKAKDVFYLNQQLANILMIKQPVEIKTRQ